MKMTKFKKHNILSNKCVHFPFRKYYTLRADILVMFFLDKMIRPKLRGQE